MFTGLVEQVGRVERAERSSGSLALTIAAREVDRLSIGDSIAVDGVCLTVTATAAGSFRAVVGPETLERTTLGALASGASVNLERPVAIGDRLGGHLVAGHVDEVGSIRDRRARGDALDLSIAASERVLRYVVAKGSIAIDGISLTVNAVAADGFDVSLIPHTQSATSLAGKRVGDAVNLEADLIGKFVEKLCTPYLPGAGA